MAKNLRTSVETLTAEVEQLALDAKLDSWNSFVTPTSVPADIYPALMCGRMELLKLVLPRPMNANEVAKLYNFIAVLIETNSALQTHASRVAQLVENWGSLFDGMASVAQKIEMFASFNHRSVIQTCEEEEMQAAIRRKAAAQRIADHVDGYDRDNLGESPDF